MANEIPFNLVRTVDKSQLGSVKQEQPELRRHLSSRVEESHAVSSRRLDNGSILYELLIDDSVLTAINAALAVGAPLLLTGEPGTGKTSIAYYLKHYFDIELYRYQVRSDSESIQLRYDFDAVRYLQDAYSGHNESPDGGEDPRASSRYLTKGPLWEALVDPAPSVLLIDEIDKAPRDFPNDLLQDLGEYQFAHPFRPKANIELAGSPPVVVITSNNERRLPDAFLRRCVVAHIEMSENMLRRIAERRKHDFPNLDNETLKLAVRLFNGLRQVATLTKRPGAAEMLMWLGVLSAKGISKQVLEKAEEFSQLPGLACLIKDHADYKTLADRQSDRTRP